MSLVNWVRPFDDFFSTDSFFGPLATTAFKEPKWMNAKVDVKEENGKMIVHAEMPGIKKEDVKVTLHDGVLSIRGARQEEKVEDDKDRKWHRVERYSGSFERHLRVPRGLTIKDIHCKYEDGVLNLDFPAKAADPPAMDTDVPIH